MPWVDVQSPHPQVSKIQKKLHKLNRKADKLRKREDRQKKDGSSWLEVKKTEKKLHATYKKIHPQRERLRLLQSDTREKLVQLLTQFYADRQVPFDRRIILHAWGDGQTRLSLQGGEDFYLASSHDLQQQKLEEYRGEINAFTKYLIDIFYQSAPVATVPIEVE